MMVSAGDFMYTFFLTCCLFTLTLCPLLLDAIITYNETRQPRPQYSLPASRKSARLTLASAHVE